MGRHRRSVKAPSHAPRPEPPRCPSCKLILSMVGVADIPVGTYSHTTARAAVFWCAWCGTLGAYDGDRWTYRHPEAGPTQPAEERLAARRADAVEAIDAAFGGPPEVIPGEWPGPGPDPLTYHP